MDGLERPPVLPPDALILLVGPSGAGKSSWAARHFRRTEILESDFFRAMVADDASDQHATPDAFRLLHGVARVRARRGLRCVVDATNLTVSARRTLRRIAVQAGVPAIAVWFDVSLAWCLANNAARHSRRVPDAVVIRHHQQSRGLGDVLRREGYASVIVLDEDDLSAA